MRFREVATPLSESSAAMSVSGRCG